VLFSGPTTEGYGVFAVLAESREDVQAIVAQDPYHVHGDREPQILEWNVVRAFRLDGPSVADIEAIATASPARQ
jgi:hypothetical protein